MVSYCACTCSIEKINCNKQYQHFFKISKFKIGTARHLPKTSKTFIACFVFKDTRIDTQIHP